ncbi:MAG: FkbM family methyltransferase [Alphaproteobacteria bacterium]|nr:FkbM family methyltransferase [Alphaproteobacteria bacterium]
MNLKMVKYGMSVLTMFMFQSGYGAPSPFAKAFLLAAHGDQKAAVQTIVDSGQGHRLRVIDPDKVPVDIKKIFSGNFLDKFLHDKIIDIGDAKLYVPNYPDDFIQSLIVNRGTFYEIEFLEELQPYIKKNAVILDIGANIGNHSVYWGLKADAKRIYSFEPVQDTFNTLKKNIKINELTDKVKIFNIGLSNEKIGGRVSYYDPKDIGRTTVKQDSDGNLLLDKLDNIQIEEDSVDFVKIDVEGHELAVFQGARETLLKYKPIIFVEIFQHKKTKVHEYLTDLGYRLEKTFPYGNYLYIFDDK